MTAGARCSLLAAVLLTTVDACGRTYRVTVPASGESPVFGVGDPYFAYEDGADICWAIESESGATALTLAFQFFQTEYEHDFVAIYSGVGESAQLIETISGELVSPSVLRLESSAMTVRFKADDTFHTTALTMQLGFHATVFDSTDESCYRDCGGHGTCDGGRCVCDEGWGASGCAIPVVGMEDGVTHQITDLGIGEWVYFKFVIPAERSGHLVELVDESHADADPRLTMEKGSLPTLSNYEFDDFFNWFYDCSDIHYLRGGNTEGGTYYVGVTNNAFRALNGATLTAKITLRLSPPREFRCLLDCNGHGECDSSSGDCSCDDGWEGAFVNSPDTCSFEIKPLVYDVSYESTVRIGNWDYYSITVAEAEAHQRSLMFEFTASSPHAFPVVLARHGEVPRLAENLLPTYDAFIFDAGDKPAYEFLSGQRYSILINQTDLLAGDWYVGVYNIWGHNGARDLNSHDSVDYTVRASIYTAGLPCPSSGFEFCSGETCDFNSGVCDCPSDKLWRDCSFEAERLALAAKSSENQLEIDSSKYYLVAVSADDLEQGENLLITVEVTSEEATPVLLARFNEMPFPGNVEHYDDHDLISTFYRDREHVILVDAEELKKAGAGDWYFSVTNSEVSTTSLDYNVEAKMSPTVECPRAHSGDKAVCSSAGECRDDLGRCDCDTGFVMDDCSADGVFNLGQSELASSSATPEKAPSIAVDDWAFWSVVIGCDAQKIYVEFATTSEGAAPLLVMRRHRLPLMVVGTYDYWDYYSGESRHGPSQSILIATCADPVYGCDGSCCIKPNYPGTVFATGAPEPGVYYIGVYNDVTLGTEPISDYSVTVTVTGGCSDDECAAGFVGKDGNCDVACPGVMPSDVYSNSPVEPELICSGEGECKMSTAAVCECEDGHVGELCELKCPETSEGHCNGIGECAVRPATVAQPSPSAVCQCPSTHGGPSCELSCSSLSDCNDHGDCRFETLTCECHTGFVGDSCEFECPKSAEGEPCPFCDVAHTFAGAEKKAVCDCEPGQHGVACDLSCPTSIYFEGECASHGACVVVEEAAECECFNGHAGPACDRNASTYIEPAISGGGGGGSSSDSGVSVGMAAALAVVSVFLLACALGFFVVAERRKRQVARYERIVRQVGVTSANVMSRQQDESGDTTINVFIDDPGGGGSFEDSAYEAPSEVELPVFRNVVEDQNVEDQNVSPFHEETIQL